jgi:hypothetical protein
MSLATARAAVLALLLASCSREAEPGSCYRAPDNACVEYGRARAAAGRRLCAGLTWAAGEESCPAEGRVGACVKAREDTTEWLYSGAPNNYTAASARSACEAAGGAFRAP